MFMKGGWRRGAAQDKIHSFIVQEERNESSASREPCAGFAALPPFAVPPRAKRSACTGKKRERGRGDGGCRVGNWWPQVYMVATALLAFRNSARFC